MDGISPAMGPRADRILCGTAPADGLPLIRLMPSEPAAVFPHRERFLVFLLAFLQLILVFWLIWTTNPPGLISPVFRVAAPDSELVHSRLSPYGPGFEKELVEIFAERSGMFPVWLHMDTVEQAWAQLRAGKVDLLVGATGDPVAIPRFGSAAPIAAGPVYASHPVAVVHQRRYLGIADMSELCTRRVMIPENPVMQRVSLEILDTQGCLAAAEYTQDGPLPRQFASALQSESRFTLVDAGRYRIWKPFFPEFQLSEYLEASVPYRWFWRADRKGFAAGLRTFWELKLGAGRFADIVDRYFGFFPERIDRFELVHMAEMITRDLPRYSNSIAEAAQRHEIDPLLLVALIYHESRFDAQAVSRTGVRGIMQLTQATAESLGVDDPDDPGQSIAAGALYLRQMWERLDRDGLEYWDRWFLALSAYNQGLGHTWDAMSLAGELGMRETSWSDVKQVFPLLSRPEYFSRARHGYTRGFEAVAHVDSVRYYYYILHGLFHLGREEGKHLGRLGLAGRVS